MPAKILLYGSYGYTGELIARFAKQDGVEIVLSGRNPHRLREQAETHGFESIAADLDDQQSIRNALRGIDVVIHCAGPFVHTYEAMAKACMETQTHYTDITGEAEVFEGLWAMDGAAKNAGVMLLPGTGADVVPSDCLAAHLKSRCPDATHLELAIRGRGGGVSHGTATTIAENIHRGGMVRQDGRLTRVATAWKTRDIDFGDGKPAHCMTIPLGDVVTAYKSTGIPNIMVYTAVPETAARILRLVRPVLPILGTRPAQAILKKRIDAAPAGPSDRSREKGINQFWGEARGADGKTVVSRLRTPEGYTLTARMALRIASKVCSGELTPGFQTPSTAYGKDLILELPGTERMDA
ncbi:MAG: saccharopine dehydrogenase NADP-binding domain-containing protein [Myxococcales bacterium]|nr:saccharopine dehydrogenase NADP-binding domain-containing protein [Myxococcales bacterium]